MWNAKSVLFSVVAIYCLCCSAATAQDTLADTKLFSKQTLTQDRYYTIKPDLRKCVSPICGGWYVTEVNRLFTTCLDGSRKKQCYVATEEFAIPRLSETQKAQLLQAMHNSKALLLGSLIEDNQYGLLRVNNAWISASDQPAKEVFVNVTNNGIVCFTTPCLNLDGQVLNKKAVKSLAELDLSAVRASDEQLALANEAVNGKEGLPVAGRYVEVTGPAGSAQGVAATQFFLKVQGEQPSLCRATGCSGQVCANENIMTTCEWRPEYACYRNAICSVQENGDCGWEMDDTLRRCLENSRLNNMLQ